ncbi:hypothetical protein A265_01881 (plasmid) [Zymomonas mobilis subsp. mobilis str. CP4 = NRRL B-14023]|uniref:Uncharacterized protein n=1 Tax=Zymomonas mobilis subsp. mobilis (strain ATCC 31821 / ZM4 / CP4) TaxID=264203 RepID=A0A806CJT5_ZYMMO|nr:hypothetical protein ZZM4_0101 [Zymomonas mobilis subsp. mobilis ZM4 = ATCC 31821]AHB11171.1 hypothetical protein ZCP4_1929 [Zymomonas mobilis subsp. mobilis str. CP4 = NRRL B-14023]AHJ71492.1 hypothetical protein A254_01909 [Zymomonas mobilis subsp. mobilis NRRL B-12526]AHJ73321.1 hypothetical protein A265_01881 [Zymomonas mobilis subsp. mobilis str. CP4 = NRRL B-14023]
MTHCFFSLSYLEKTCFVSVNSNLGFLTEAYSAIPDLLIGETVL